MGLGLPELIVILAIMLLLFGSKKLPTLAKSLGESAGELQKGLKNGIQSSGSVDATDEKKS